MNTLIYGNEQPKISFTQSPEGGITFTIENKRQVKLEPDQHEITWRHIYPKSYRFADLSHVNRDFSPDSEDDKSIFDEFVSELADITGSETERKFLLDYAEAVWSRSECPWDTPALIPQVWVNWIHYDPHDKLRARRVQKEPFRVDFVMKDSEISQNLVIIEIDGPSHFGQYSIDPGGKTRLDASMDAYTQHLRKDRWLRKNGWDVFRISSLEIEERDDSSDLFLDVLGCWVGEAPF